MDLLVFPNQLFEHHPGFDSDPDRVILIEDSLFFGDYHYPEVFHRQKLWLLRTAMKKYEDMLRKNGWTTVYLEHDQGKNSLLGHLKSLARGKSQRDQTWTTTDPVDFMLRKRLERCARQLDANLRFEPNPGYLNKIEINAEYRANRKRWFMADFYKFQRRRLDVLMNGQDPAGGQWSFDEANRKKIPKNMLTEIPELPSQKSDKFAVAAEKHISKRYKKNPGEINLSLYPTCHREAEKWLKEFFENRFLCFGDYEDAIEKGENFLWHSVLTPMLNTGLLTPRQVLDETLLFLGDHDIPLNSAEGFIRQIIGWREFIRATYDDLGVRMRTSNHWKHHRPLPQSFYDGTTGIEPLDDCIQRVQATGYCHHIERLMVLGGFMFLCEIEPDQIYRWFMEMFVDSYDWVMVPNVYAMSQHADGGLITTKPYFSGSAYIKKMSHYSNGRWCEIWDGLYWRWIWKHRKPLAKNPRWAMMCKAVVKMDGKKRKLHLSNAENFLKETFENPS